ncbi:MAG: fatty acid desaturase [Chitinophagaceae bacterium]|nr:fatty acid desaturase [Chitinophagaceae bacterium]
MKQLNPIQDPVYHQPESFSAYERFWLNFMNDKRDLSFLHLLTLIHLTVIPLGLILFTPLFQGYWWWIAYVVWFFLAQIRLRGPFGLMLHNISHRRLFKKKFNWLNKYVIWFVCPFFGHTPETYFAHHVGMHHEENNMPDDASSTLPYQRDSWKDFLKYYINFLFLGFRDTFVYLFTRKKKKYYVNLTLGEMTFYAVSIGLCFVNLKAALWVLIIPFLVSRLIMMLGNWTQHAFVDPHEPENMYKNCFNCINTNYNTKCWNDGYHLIHHLKPGIHYTDMPVLFLKEKENIAREKSLVFDGVHYLHLFLYLMTRRYDKMARHLVNIENSFSSEEEAIKVLKERTGKFRLKAA